MHTFSTHEPALPLIGIMLARARAAAERLYITSSGFGLVHDAPASGFRRAMTN
jgi:hypothetical protein